MILVHKLSHAREPFHLNPDLVTLIESNPDTVVSLTTGAKVVVAETSDEVIDAIRRWRVSLMREASSLVQVG